jgi:genome maintenance exonuclease 1
MEIQRGKNIMIFTHKPITVPKLKRTHVDGIRLYEEVDTKQPGYYTSITSITSHWSKSKFAAWRKRVGEDEANRITKRATTRGTHTHSLIENFLNNEYVPKADPLPTYLFNNAKTELNKINNIIGIEIGLFSKYLGIAGTADCIAEFDGVLSVIDFKTSEKPKPVEWIEGYFVQATAYAMMLYELTGEMAKQLVIIMTCEDGEVIVYKETNLKKYILLLNQYINKFNADKESEYGSI